MLIALAAKYKLRILCAREIQLSILDSVHQLLRDQIIEMGMEPLYTVTNNAIRCVNGSEFTFSGLHRNISKIKGKESIDIVWVEEAESVSKHSWEVLEPTIRKKGSEIWTTFNPNQPTDPTYVKYVKEPPPDAEVRFVGWWDNDWFSDELMRHKQWMEKVDPEAALHVYGGQCNKKNKAQVLFGKISIAAFEPAADWHGPYFGVDWGASEDPTVMTKSWIREFLIDGITYRDLHVEREAYKVGLANDDIAPFFMKKIPGANRYRSWADSARPETIRHVRTAKDGFPKMRPAKKAPGSVEDGIQHLRSFRKIVIHPRCEYTIQEGRLWRWKTDRLTGEVLATLVEKFDHCWDSIRYALEPIMTHQKKSYAGYQSANKKGTHLPAATGGRFRSKTGGVL